MLRPLYNWALGLAAGRFALPALAAIAAASTAWVVASCAVIAVCSFSLAAICFCRSTDVTGLRRRRMRS